MNAGRPRSVLVIGYGNPGRLRRRPRARACAEAVAALDLPGVTVDSDYQLTVEDAAAVAAARRGASSPTPTRAGPEPFAVRRLGPGSRDDELQHPQRASRRPCWRWPRTCSAPNPRPMLLGIRGYEFNEFGEGLSARAATNLAAALDWARGALSARDWAPVPDSAPGPAATSEEGDA